MLWKPSGKVRLNACLGLDAAGRVLSLRPEHFLEDFGTPSGQDASTHPFAKACDPKLRKLVHPVHFPEIRVAAGVFTAALVDSRDCLLISGVSRFRHHKRGIRPSVRVDALTIGMAGSLGRMS